MSREDQHPFNPEDPDTRVTAGVDAELDDTDPDYQDGTFSSAEASDLKDENEEYAELAESGVADADADMLEDEEGYWEDGVESDDIDEEELETDIDSLDFDDQEELENEPDLDDDADESDR